MNKSTVGSECVESENGASGERETQLLVFYTHGIFQYQGMRIQHAAI